MIVLFAIVFSIGDTLPPLPDLSLLVLPEPEPWLEPRTDKIAFNCLAGQVFRVDCSSRVQSFAFDLVYHRKRDWTTINACKSDASYAIPLSHLWLKPSLSYYHQKIGDRYVLVEPAVAFTSAFPWFVSYGNLYHDHWEINEQDTKETASALGIVFDRSIYLPQLDFALIQTGTGVETKAAAKIHINNLQFGYETMIHPGFPSPKVLLAYQTPLINITASLRSGLVLNHLKDLFIPETPYRYTGAIPDESLKIGATLSCGAEYQKHRIRLTASYDSYIMRLVLDENYEYIPARSINDALVSMNALNTVVARGLNITNSFSLQHRWADRTIPLMPREFFRDSMDLSFSFIYVSIVAVYIHERRGVAGPLPAVFIADQMLGLRSRFIEIFAAIYNLTNYKEPYYDGYSLKGRKYGMGIGFMYAF